jgi:glycosyltransferase involved in cell wall biosynthesis
MKILAFPKDKNPYQELLYAPLRKRGVEIRYIFPSSSSQIVSLLLLIILLPYYKSKGFKIFHLHWVGGFKAPIKILQPFYSWYFLFVLKFIKHLGYRLVWTVHNVLPHEKQFVDDLKARKILSELADAKIVHSSYTIEEMKKLKLNTVNSSTIPIGSYTGIYENRFSEEKARKYLGLNKKDFVFLFFGAIRRYKGIEALLEAFEKLSKKNKAVKLIIAGNCEDKDLSLKIERYKKRLRGKLIFDGQFIEDDKLQYYFNSADVAVFPFKEVTTTSSALTALSFTKPIITPRLGCLREFPENVGFFYAPGKKNALYAAMSTAIKNKNKLNMMGKRAFNYAKSLSWDKIAEKTLDLYRRLIE